MEDALTDVKAANDAPRPGQSRSVESGGEQPNTASLKQCPVLFDPPTFHGSVGHTAEQNTHTHTLFFFYSFYDKVAFWAVETGQKVLSR